MDSKYLKELLLDVKNGKKDIDGALNELKDFLLRILAL